MHQFDIFSVLRPFYVDLSSSISLLPLAYFDLLSNLEVKFGQKSRSKVGGSKYQKGRIYENGRINTSTFSVFLRPFSLMRSQNKVKKLVIFCFVFLTEERGTP